ncbi:MAG TPA: class I SAM-dependent methyltransferase [Gemmatimonadales bacterium]|nr:class I SAM-dependent methyltransferase [Gemmatimonadales bacterium]
MNQADEYDRQYRYWLERQSPDAKSLDWRLRHLLWRHRVLLRRYPPAGKRVLDYGCMDGVFSFALARAGGRVVGYDVAPAAIAQACAFQGRTGGPVFTLETPERRAFDLVFCCEVLEHVPDDRAFVGGLVSYLAPGGMLVGTTPVGRSFWDPDHKRVYDERTLRRALEPWGGVRLARYYRTPLRNLLPWPQRGAAVFVFDVTPR